MKKIISPFCLVLISFISFSQTSSSSEKYDATQFTKIRPYIGFGTGINSATGIFGAKVDFQVAKTFMVGAGLGLGSWGGKFSFTGYYITKKNWNPFFGIGYATGLDSVPVTLPQQEQAPNQKVVFKYDPVTTINFGVQKNWYSKRGSRFYLDLGLSFSTEASPYLLKTKNYILSENVKNAMDFASPGGLIVGIGYCFKLGKN